MNADETLPGFLCFVAKEIKNSETHPRDDQIRHTIVYKAEDRKSVTIKVMPFTLSLTLFFVIRSPIQTVQLPASAYIHPPFRLFYPTFI
jgi:hypothetical protein